MPDEPKRQHGHLTDEELAEFREIFNLVDLDKGGTISKEELKQLMNTLGLKPSDEPLRCLSSAWYSACTCLRLTGPWSPVPPHRGKGARRARASPRGSSWSSLST